jgi:hypothetical protein
VAVSDVWTILAAVLISLCAITLALVAWAVLT